MGQYVLHYFWLIFFLKQNKESLAMTVDQLLPVTALFRFNLHFGNVYLVKNTWHPVQSRENTKVIGTGEQHHWMKESKVNFPPSRVVLSFQCRMLQEGAALGAQTNKNARPIANLPHVQRFQQKSGGHFLTRNSSCK